MATLADLVAPLDGFKLVVATDMIGAKKAVLHKGRLYVSPAMSRLIQGATKKELAKLFRAIEVKVIK